MSLSLVRPEATELKPRIVVFGVGGAGGNAVNNMIDAGLEGVGDADRDARSGLASWSCSGSSSSESGAGDVAPCTATWRYAGRRRLALWPVEESRIAARARDPTSDAPPAITLCVAAAIKERRAARVQ